MKYKPGDRVRIADNLVGGQSYANEGGSVTYFNSDMRKYCGQVVTIADCMYDSVYSIKEDGRWWSWSIGMLEPLESFEVLSVQNANELNSAFAALML